MKNAGFGRSLLKVCAIFCTIGSILVLLCAILALTNKVPEINQTVMDMVKNESYYSQLPANFPGLVLMVAFAFTLVETYLMWRAVRDPKKSTFLIIISFISLIGNGILAVTKGTSTQIATDAIISITWSVVLLIALICARSEAATAATTETKTANAKKTTKTVKEPTKKTAKTATKATEKKEVKEES